MGSARICARTKIRAYQMITPSLALSTYALGAGSLRYATVLDHRPCHVRRVGHNDDLCARVPGRKAEGARQARRSARLTMSRSTTLPSNARRGGSVQDIMAGQSGGQGQDRTVDLPLFRCSGCPAQAGCAGCTWLFTVASGRWRLPPLPSRLPSEDPSGPFRF